MSDQLKQIARISSARVTLVDAQGRVFADSEKDIAPNWKTILAAGITEKPAEKVREKIHSALVSPSAWICSM